MMNLWNMLSALWPGSLWHRQSQETATEKIARRIWDKDFAPTAFLHASPSDAGELTKHEHT
jgi:hypothetical protein